MASNWKKLQQQRQHHETSVSMKVDKHDQKDTSLIPLSLVWLGLCFVLVWKYPPLIAVFWVFLACFLMAGLFSLQTILWNDNKNQSGGFCNRTVRMQVGIAMCALALWMMQQTQHANNTFFLALCSSAGYLAFDHWFVAVWCKPPPPPSLFSAMEDALTLTVMVIRLVQLQHRHHHDASFSHHQKEQTEVELSALTTWLTYKLIRLALRLQSLSDRSVRSMSPVSSCNQLHANQNCAHSTTESATTDTSVATDGDNNHTVQSTLLWKIHGVSYDLQDYVATHPGGAEAILLGQARDDCTALFESYHPFASRAQLYQILNKYRVKESHWTKKTTLPTKTPRENSNTTTKGQPSDTFYAILCQRVEKTLSRTHEMSPRLDRAASLQRTCYYGAVVVAVTVSAVAHARGSIVGSILLAVTGWFLGALGHDAGHFAASRSPFWNNVGLWGMSLLCNPILWQHQHTYAHHSFTNEFDNDPDLHHFHLLLRVHERFRHVEMYKYQSHRWFVVLAYTMVTLGTCFWIPIGLLRDGHIYSVVEFSDRRRPLRAMALWVHLLLYSGFIMIWPFIVHPHWHGALVAVVTHLFTSGLIFAFFSQINHINELSLAVSPRERHINEPLLRDSWAVAQIETSNNYCPQSVLWHILSNGLNLQIEHHLFPGLNHCHLPLIQRTVQDTCREFGVVYKCYDSWSQIMSATMNWLEKLSDEPTTYSSS